MNSPKFIDVTKQQILFIDDLEQIIGRNRLTLRRWWSAGIFPKPAKLHGRTLAWRSSTILEWIDRTLPEKNDEQPSSTFC